MISFHKTIGTSLLLATILGTSSCQQTPPVTSTDSTPKTATGTNAAPATGTNTVAAPALDLKTEDDKISYIIGLDTGRHVAEMKQHGVNISVDIASQGMHDAVSGKPQLTEDQITTIVSAFKERMQADQQKQQEQQAAQDAALSAKNGKAGADFLAQNKSKDGIKVTKSGLQYKIVKKGAGKKSPLPSDTVQANYSGSLIDGTVFDSSEKNGGPVSFPVNKVIPGWTEALQMMHEGDKYQIFVPASLAYGDQAPEGSPIPPNSTLIFDIELVKITKGEAEPAK